MRRDEKHEDDRDERRVDLEHNTGQVVHVVPRAALPLDAASRLTCAWTIRLNSSPTGTVTIRPPVSSSLRSISTGSHQKKAGSYLDGVQVAGGGGSHG